MGLHKKFLVIDSDNNGKRYTVTLAASNSAAWAAELSVALVVGMQGQLHWMSSLSF